MSGPSYLFTAYLIGLLALLSPSARAETEATAEPAASTEAEKVTPKPPPVVWHDVTSWGVEGREWAEEKRLSWFDRFPAAAQKNVTPSVWGLSRHSTGMVVRFKTDARVIHVHYKLSKAALALPQMPATGVSGIDLYARDGRGQWRWVQVTRPDKQEVQGELARDLAPGYREYAAYLPLYNGVEFVSFGVPPGAKFAGLPPRTQPIVFYGTSITHGFCASRPGMTHVAILGRRLDRPVVNLGFSGQGRMDAAVGDYLVKIDAAAYVIDCLPNMTLAMINERTLPLVKQLRAAKPTTPILLVEDRRYSNEWIVTWRATTHTKNHAALQAAYAQLKQAGVGNLYYINGDALFGTDGEGSVDGSHPSDLGFMRQADAMEPVLRQALQQR